MVKKEKERRIIPGLGTRTGGTLLFRGGSRISERGGGGGGGLIIKQLYTKSVGHYYTIHGTSFEKKSKMDRLNFFFGTSITRVHESKYLNLLVVIILYKTNDKITSVLSSSRSITTTS